MTAKFYRFSKAIVFAALITHGLKAIAGETKSSGWQNSVFGNSVVGKDDPCTNPNRKCDLLKQADPTQFMNQLAKISLNVADSMRTTGTCMAGVAYTVTDLCFNQKSAICGNATGSGKCFTALGFKKCAFTQANRSAMQDLKIKGGIYVYSGGPAGNGHVEVNTGDSTNPWCSDHCSHFAMQSPERVPEGIFVPPTYEPPAGSHLECDK